MLLDATGHCPNLSAPAETIAAIRDVPRRRVTSPDDALQDTAEDLYENAPCGYLSTRPDGTILRVNRTFVAWTGSRARRAARRTALPGPARARRPDLLRDALRAAAADAGLGPRDRGRDRARRRHAPARAGQLACCAAPATAPRARWSSARRSSTRPTGAATSRSCCARAGASRTSPSSCSAACCRERCRQPAASDRRWPTGRAVSGLEVGGDWYDAFWLDEGGDGRARRRRRRRARHRGRGDDGPAAQRGARARLDGAGTGAPRSRRSIDYARRHGVGRMTTLVYAGLNLDVRAAATTRAPVTCRR